MAENKEQAKSFINVETEEEKCDGSKAILNALWEK